MAAGSSTNPVLIASSARVDVIELTKKIKPLILTQTGLLSTKI